MSRLGNPNPFVGTVCAVNNNLVGFQQYLDLLDPEMLVAEKFGLKLKQIITSLIDQIKVRVELRSKDIANVEDKIKQIDEEISNVKVALPTDNSEADTPEKSTQDILDNVYEALAAKSTDIAQMIVDREDPESIKAVIVSTVRTEIIASLKEESEQYSTALGTAVQESISDLATIEVDTNFMNDFSEIFVILNGYISTLLNLGGIWGKLAQVILPFLPNVLNWLFGKSDEDVLEEVRVKVMDKCVNEVITGIRPTIFKITVDNQKRIQEKIQAELVSKMEKVKEGLREKMADANKSKEEVEAEITKLTSAISHLNTLLSEI